jgi:hypothetical protein
VPTDQNHLTLYNIPAGSYEVSLEFQFASAPFTHFPTSRKVSSLIVSQLKDLLPSLIAEPVIEHGISPEVGAIPEINFAVTVKAHPMYPSPEILSQTDTCFTLLPAPNSTLQKMAHCTTTSPTLQFSLRQIPRGIHSYSLVLRSRQNPEVSFEQSAVSGLIVVEDMREFVPSYDWTDLKPWHTIPSGLETRQADLLCHF